MKAIKVRFELVAIFVTALLVFGVVYLSGNYPEYSDKFMTATTNMAFAIAVIAIGGFIICAGNLVVCIFKYLVTK